MAPHRRQRHGLANIDDLDGTLAAVARVLQGGGRLVFSILHLDHLEPADELTGQEQTGVTGSLQVSSK